MPPYAPQALAFPYKVDTPIGTIWSERPLPPEALAKAVSRVRASMALTPLAEPREQRSIFLTDGGWRWKWLAPGHINAFAISRPLTKAVVINHTSPFGQTVRNGAAVGGERTLGGVIAHEFTHGLIRRRFGVLAAQTFPTWKVEGYCDHVAGESSLDEDQVRQLEAAGQKHGALVYFHGRRRVEAILQKNGNDVEALFAAE